MATQPKPGARKSKAGPPPGRVPVRKFRRNPLFREDFNSDMNAAVGDNGGPYDFDAYGQGFFEGGFAVITSAREGSVPLDILIYPIAFSFRHGLELYIKYLLVELRLHNTSVAEYKQDHKLESNWKAFVKAAEASGFDEFQPEQVAQAGVIVSQFCEIDPNGQMFRYPEDIKGNRHLTDVALINVDVLERGMRRLHGIFEGWHLELYERRGAREVADAEARDKMGSED